MGGMISRDRHRITESRPHGAGGHRRQSSMRRVAGVEVSYTISGGNRRAEFVLKFDELICRSWIITAGRGLRPYITLADCDLEGTKRVIRQSHLPGPVLGLVLAMHWQRPQSGPAPGLDGVERRASPWSRCCRIGVFYSASALAADIDEFLFAAFCARLRSLLRGAPLRSRSSGGSGS